jgi:hypothetical protein
MINALICGYGCSTLFIYLTSFQGQKISENISQAGSTGYLKTQRRLPVFMFFNSQPATLNESCLCNCKRFLNLYPAKPVP